MKSFYQAFIFRKKELLNFSCILIEYMHRRNYLNIEIWYNFFKSGPY